ncbi:S8 family peptidase [Simiduia sp. 21SJ11W-1]|uniref:S8 family serine peptidase n=1 Tax=Simiduia sp. 21SJ11W-1 TaxID=2909669 RepID=UPI0020A220F3|nr:S8 family serine peptidase [Simiduia sp. 21SJ11W-1]UTA46867.1 S8 family peptidase [Simiduia sp. 21SJ11W-1]
MNKSKNVLTPVIKPLAMAVGLLAASGAHAGQFIAATADKAIEGQYIVVLKQNTLAIQSQSMAPAEVRAMVEAKVGELARAHGATASQHFSAALQGGVLRMNERAAQRLANHPQVAIVEQDQIVSIDATQNNATWGLDRIDQRSSSLDTKYNYTSTGAGVRAYVIDTGVNSHPDFGGRVQNGWDFVDNDGNSSDCQGHGTHVAGTVASSTWGVAKGATVVGVRVLGCNGSGTNSGVISGIDWVAQNHVKPAVANMSLGGGASTAVDNAVANLVNAGVVTVVAAGNDNSNACNYSPAREASAITVGSTAQGDARSYFSNYGSCVDIFAPGSSITSTSQSGGSTTMSGTSMASPHVAGVAALYLAENPGATPAQVEAALEGAATQNAISDTKGSPNLMLYSLLDGTPPPPPPGGDELENGVPVTGLGASQGSDITYTMEVPAGASDIKFQISGGSGDADLYVRYGSAPTDSVYDCRPYLNGNNETCNMNQGAGTYHVRVKAYSTFSGLTLQGSYSTSTGPSPIDTEIATVNVNQGSWARYYYDLPAGYSNLEVSISGGSGDADLYVRFGAQSSTSSYDCRPYKWGNAETCTFSNPAGGRWHMDVRGYSSSSNVKLRLKAN